MEILRRVALEGNPDKIAANLLSNGEEYLSRQQASSTVAGGSVVVPAKNRGPSGTTTKQSEIPDRTKNRTEQPGPSNLASGSAAGPTKNRGPQTSSFAQAVSTPAPPAPPVPTLPERQRKQAADLDQTINKIEKLSAPRVDGGEEWEIVLPKGIDIIGHIKPYLRSLQNLLGVRLHIKMGQGPIRLFVGPSLWHPKDEPEIFQKIYNWEHRARAWRSLMSYVTKSMDDEMTPDIMSYMLALKVDQTQKNLDGVLNVHGQLSKATVAATRVPPPPAPSGPFTEVEPLIDLA